MAKSSPDAYYVLVVEDDPIIMMSMVDLVEQAGCLAVEAYSVAEAIAILEVRADIRTVFTDLDMRGSTARMRFAVAIRDRWPPVELVMVSSRPWAETDVPARGVLLGKPFDQHRIVAALRTFAA